MVIFLNIAVVWKIYSLSEELKSIDKVIYPIFFVSSQTPSPFPDNTEYHFPEQWFSKLINNKAITV